MASTNNLDQSIPMDTNDNTAAELASIRLCEGATEKIMWTESIGQLTPELFVGIMKFLSSDDILRCSHVDRTWRKYILAESELWDNLRITPATASPGAKVALWAERQAQDKKSLRELVLNGTGGSYLAPLRDRGMTRQLTVFRAHNMGDSWRNNLDKRYWELALMSGAVLKTLSMVFNNGVCLNQDFETLLSFFPHLEELELVGVNDSVHLTSPRPLLSNSPFPETPAELARVATKLRRLRLISIQVQPIYNNEFLGRNPSRGLVIPSLEEIYIKCTQSSVYNSYTLYPLIDWAHLPNLKTLRAEFKGSYHQVLGVYAVGTPDFHRISWFGPPPVAEFPSLKSLTVIDFARHNHIVAPKPTRSILAPVLQTLTLSGGYFEAARDFLVTNALNYPSLKKLVVRGAQLCYVPHEQLRTILAGIARITHFDIKGTGFCDAGLGFLAEHATELVSLDVSGCDSITGPALVRLVQARATSGQGGWSGLRVLKMVDCGGVDYISVKWVRQNVERVVGSW